jgi:hypothetical protein
MGGSISVAVMGALLNGRMADRLTDIPGVSAGETADSLLTEEDRVALPVEVLDAMQHALSASLHEVFFVVLAAAVLCLAAASFFPRGKLDSERISRAPRPVARGHGDAPEAGAAVG